MGYPWYSVLGVWVAVWAAMLVVAQHSWLLGVVGVGLMAGHIAEWILKGLQNTRQRKNITDVESKAVFITGCDSGFGLHLASQLATLGFKVYAGCLDPEGPGATELKQGSPRVIPLRCDVTSEEDVAAAYKLVEDDLEVDEHLWAVVNNAGIAAITEIEWCSLATFRHHLEVNALGPVLVTKTFLPLMREKGGRVIIVASLAGRYTLPGFSAYSMSKHAAVSFADGLRLEMRKWNISVHTIEPALYKTPISNVASNYESIERLWKECPEEVRRSYGRDYLEEFKQGVGDLLNNAKPSEKVQEVILDLVDAVAGVNPKRRYVPSVATQIRARLLAKMPVPLREKLLLRSTPSSPLPGRTVRRKTTPSLIDPRSSAAKARSALTRHYSVPSTEKTDVNTPSPTPVPETKFPF